MANPVTHFEIHGRDGKKTQDFYASLFGWDVDADNPMNYGMVPAPGGVGIGGGIAEARGEPMVTNYVEVEGLDSTLKNAETLGGKSILPPSDVSGGPKLA